jgi:hypothetical protein
MYTLEAALGWLCGASLLEEKKPRSTDGSPRR